MQAEDYKQAIDVQKVRIAEEGDSNKAELIKQLAVLYLKDQNQEMAFESFLASLASLKEEPAEKETEGEGALYQKALETYLGTAHFSSSKEKSKQMIEEYAPLLKEHPTPWQLAYLVALAYANIDQYEEFFNLFFRSYRYYPRHFLSYKTKGILHIKLMERRRDEALRKAERAAALQDFELALALEPKDESLYRLLITFSFPETKSEQAQRCLNKIVEGNIIVSRSDIMFYVQAAIEAKDVVLAQRFVDKARVWYAQSKIVDAAQIYIDNHK